MLGWWVTVIPETEWNKSPAEGKRHVLAEWETGVSGLSWLDDLAKAGKVVAEKGCGYPNLYRATAGVIFPILTRGLPENDSPLVIGDDYVLPQGWNGKLNLDQEGMANCPADEPLVLEAWDLS